MGEEKSTVGDESWLPLLSVQICLLLSIKICQCRRRRRFPISRIWKPEKTIACFTVTVTIKLFLLPFQTKVLFSSLGVGFLLAYLTMKIFSQCLGCTFAFVCVLNVWILWVGFGMERNCTCIGLKNKKKFFFIYAHFTQLLIFHAHYFYLAIHACYLITLNLFCLFYLLFNVITYDLSFF